MNRPFDEYLGYDHSNYSIPFIQREAVEFAYSVNVRSNGPVLDEGSLDRIQDKSETRIFIKEFLDALKSFEIRGTRQQVLDALTGFKESLRNDVFIVSERAMIHLRVPPEMIGCLIGKAGKNIKSIKESSRVGIRVDSELIFVVFCLFLFALYIVVEERSQVQTVRIIGGIEEVLDAHQKVREKSEKE